MNFNRANFVWGLIGGAVGAGMVLLTTAVSYGEMKSDIRSLQERTAKLEDQVGKVARPKVLKGDLCLSLFQNYPTSSGSERKSIEDQIQKLDCYSGVASNAVMPSDQSRKTASKAQTE